MTSVFRDNPTLASAFYFPMTAINTVAGMCSIAYSIVGYNTTLLGSISAINYALSLIDNRQKHVLVVSSDDISTNMLDIYRKGSFVSNHYKGAFLGKIKFGFLIWQVVYYLVMNYKIVA